MDFVKFTKVLQLMIHYPSFNLFYQQLVQPWLYQGCTYNPGKSFAPILKNSLLLMNTLSKIPFHFVKKFLTKIQIYLWHLLIFSLCLQIYLWMKRLIFRLIWFFVKKKKVEGMLKRHFKQLLSVKSSCFLFNDNCYKKVEGVAMGSPLGPTNYW